MCYGIGGTIACLLGGWWLTIWPGGFGAQLSYALTAVFVAVLGISGPFLNPKLEENQKEMVQMSFWPRTKTVFSEIGQGLKIKELYTTLIYQTILTCVVPTFTTYLYYYYNLNPGRNFSNF